MYFPLLINRIQSVVVVQLYTVPKVIDFPRYNMKCSGVNQILRGIFHGVSRFPLHFMLYRGNFDYFFDSVYSTYIEIKYVKDLRGA